MPSVAPLNPREASHDLEDDEFDDAIEDFLKDLPIEKDNGNDNEIASAEPTRDIDEEIKIKKKRKPVPKLDESRLLSQDGIPRLRKITKSRLRFKGKGHEFSDISRLLNMYQLWLDDLYPRAKFRDALSMVEKVGHSNRMKVTRKAWLDDTKPFRKDEHTDTEEVADLDMSGALPVHGDQDRTSAVRRDDMEGERSPSTKDSNRFQQEPNDGPDDDELDALLAETDTGGATTQTHTNRATHGPFEEDSDEDELDALLAAESVKMPELADPTTIQSGNKAPSRHKALQEDFADEEEVMASLDLW